jgi:serpin B
MKHTRTLLACAFSGVLAATAGGADEPNPVAAATNALGLDLYRQFADQPGNLCLSPYSIQAAFAMTTNGAAGETLEQMRTALHLPADLDSLNGSFAELVADFEQRGQRAADHARRFRADEPGFQLAVANRLFGQQGYPFDPAFLGILADRYAAPLQPADFRNKHDSERLGINQWVEEQTRRRIRDLLPAGAITGDTRLVLVNALHFKAAWREQFAKSATKPAPFHLASGAVPEVPTMHQTERFGYAKEDGYTALTLPYSEGFSMLLVVPDEINGLPAIERGLGADKLSALARLPARRVALHFPKFRIEGATVPLKGPLEKLGIKLAFTPAADFGRMTSDKKLPGLYISDAYHRTFIAVDEKGTEAAAATAVAMVPLSAMPRPEDPVVVKVDRPFFYAIVDGRSRTALFVGRVQDPR